MVDIPTPEEFETSILPAKEKAKIELRERHIQKEVDAILDRISDRLLDGINENFNIKAPTYREETFKRVKEVLKQHGWDLIIQKWDTGFLGSEYSVSCRKL